MIDKYAYCAGCGTTFELGPYYLIRDMICPKCNAVKLKTCKELKNMDPDNKRFFQVNERDVLFSCHSCKDRFRCYTER